MDEQRGGELSPDRDTEHSRAMDLLSFANEDPLGGRQTQHGERAFGELLEAAQADSGDGTQHQLDAGLGQGPPPPPAGQGRKRKRPGQNGDEGEDGDDQTAVKNKKESHVRALHSR